MGLTNKKINSINESATLAVKTKANELKAKGREILDLGCGEPDIDTPEHIKEAARTALAQGKTKYTAVAGIPELREGIAKKFTEYNGIPTKASNVVITNGGKQAIYAAFDTTLEPGDEVIVPAPYWVSYTDIVTLASGRPVVLKTKPENGYKLTPAELKAALTPKTKWFIMNSPSNPTGAAYSEAEQRALADVLTPTSAMILSDEVYERVTFGEFKAVSFAKAAPSLASRTLTVNAFSKSYSMTGWRVGYATGPTEIIAAMIKHQGQSTSNVCSISQYAALAALHGSHDFIPQMNRNFERRIDMVIGMIEKSKGLTVASKPEGAFYLFVRIDALLKSGKVSGSADFSTKLLDKMGVAVVPGAPFGDDAAFRLSVSGPENELKLAVQKIVELVDSM